jgi:hypothetical protein
MQKIVLTKAETRPSLPLMACGHSPQGPAQQKRLSLLGLTERRQWPKGPLWRTALGDRYIRRGPNSNN